MTKNSILMYALLTAACGGSTEIYDNSNNGTGGSGGEELPSTSQCAIDAPGEAFSFEVENTGTRTLHLAYGCGKTIPIELDTTEGARRISPGGANVCEFSCDMVYAGHANAGCSDCGPGEGVLIKPGERTTIVWDRRIYVEHVAPSACSGNENGNDCALGVQVDAASVTSGTLTFCADEQGNHGGNCSDGETVFFPIDLTRSEVVIGVK